MAIQHYKNYVFKFLEYGTLFCQLTIGGIVHFLDIHSFFFCICGSIVLILSIIFNILGLLKAHLFLETHVFLILPLHGPFLLHKVARWKQAKS